MTAIDLAGIVALRYDLPRGEFARILRLEHDGKSAYPTNGTMTLDDLRAMTGDPDTTPVKALPVVKMHYCARVLEVYLRAMESQGITLDQRRAEELAEMLAHVMEAPRHAIRLN